MSDDRIGKVLERVAQELAGDCVFEIPLEDCNCAECKTMRSLGKVLEERLGPLLRAGQAMREHSRRAVVYDTGEPERMWDAALATLEGRDGK